MDSEFTDALLRAKTEAIEARLKMRASESLPRDHYIVLAVARVALERAAARLRAEAAETMAGLKTCEDRDTSHLVIGLLRSMADDVEGLLPVERTPNG